MRLIANVSSLANLTQEIVFDVWQNVSYPFAGKKSVVDLVGFEMWYIAHMLICVGVSVVTWLVKEVLGCQQTLPSWLAVVLADIDR